MEHLYFKKEIHCQRLGWNSAKDPRSGMSVLSYFKSFGMIVKGLICYIYKNLIVYYTAAVFFSIFD